MPDILYVMPEGEVSPLKLKLLDGRVPKGSDDPAHLPEGLKIEVEYKEILHQLVAIRAMEPYEKLDRRGDIARIEWESQPLLKKLFKKYLSREKSCHC